MIKAISPRAIIAIIGCLFAALLFGGSEVFAGTNNVKMEITFRIFLN